MKGQNRYYTQGASTRSEFQRQISNSCLCKFVSETPLRVDAPYINQYFPTFSCKHERLWEFRSRRRRKNLSTSKYILLQRSFKTIQAQKYLIQRILKAFAHHITLHFARFPTLQCLVNYKHIVCHHFSKSASHSLLYKRWSNIFRSVLAQHYCWRLGWVTCHDSRVGWKSEKKIGLNHSRCDRKTIFINSWLFFTVFVAYFTCHVCTTDNLRTILKSSFINWTSSGRFISLLYTWRIHFYQLRTFGSEVRKNRREGMNYTIKPLVNA